MSVMDKFLNYMKLNNDDDDDDFYDDDYLEDEEIDTSTSKRTNSKDVDEAEENRSFKKTVQSKVTPINRITSKRTAGSGMEVCVIKPTSYEEAREITETLLSNRTIVLNLEGLDIDIAQKIIDFTSGSCYAIRGNLQKISNYIFIITPPSVDLSGDYQDIFSGAFDSLTDGL